MIQEHKREVLEAQAEKKRLEEDEKRLQAAWQLLEDIAQLDERSEDARHQSLKRARSSLSKDPKKISCKEHLQGRRVFFMRRVLQLMLQQKSSTPLCHRG